MADPAVIAVPAEMLAGYGEALRDGVQVARDTATGLRALEAKIDALAKLQAEHAAREEPALQAHADYLRRMTDADADATAEARAAKRKAETEGLKRRTELQGLVVRILVGLGSLIIAALAGAGATTALGGP